MQWRRQLAAWGAAAVGTCFIVFTFSPGIALDEAVYQLAALRNGDYDDNTALFTWVWRILDHFHRGALGPLILQSLMYFGGLALVALKLAQRPLAIAGVVLGIGLFPANLYMLAFVLKDVQMISALMLAFGLLWHAERSSPAAAGALVLLLYAQCVRHNAPAATLPLVLWLGAIVAARLGWRGWRAPVLGMALFALLTVTSATVERRLQPGTTAQYQMTLGFDLAAVSLANHESYLPPCLSQESPERQLENLKVIFDPTEGQTLFFDFSHERPDGRVLPILSGDSPDLAQLKSVWLRTIARHPFSYLHHRLRLYWGLLSRFYFPEWPDTHPNDLGLRFPKTEWNHSVQSFLASLAQTPICRGWLYLLACLGAGWLAWRRRDRAIGALVASGLLFQLSFLPAAFTIVFKYNWWMVSVAVVAAVASFCWPRTS